MQVCGIGLHLPSPLYTPSINLCMLVQCHALGGARALYVILSGQQAVSDREGFSARVQQVGVYSVWCRCVACFFLACPSPLPLGAAVFCMQLSALLFFFALSDVRLHSQAVAVA